MYNKNKTKQKQLVEDKLAALAALATFQLLLIGNYIHTPNPIRKWYKRRINAIRTRLVAKLISMQNVFFIHLVIALDRSVHNGSLFCTHLFRFPCAQWIIHMHKWFSVKLTHHHHNHHLFNESVGMCSKKIYFANLNNHKIIQFFFQMQ